MSRQIPPCDGKTPGCLPSSPCNETRLCEFSFPVDSSCRRNDAGPFVTQQAEWLCSANHGSIGELFAYRFFLVVRRGHRVSRKTQCPKHTPNGIMDTHPRTRASEEPTGHRPERNPGEGLSTDAQAACCFRCSASKLTPFFQTIKVMAAILRARVRRAIVGFAFPGLPDQKRGTPETVQGRQQARVAAPLKMFFRS